MLEEIVEAQMDPQQQQQQQHQHQSHQYRQQKEEIDLLLEKWHLPELKSKFKEQEVTIRSLQFLTKEDISELIPKIGPRAIFRARLFDWQQQQHEQYEQQEQQEQQEHQQQQHDQQKQQQQPEQQQQQQQQQQSAIHKSPSSTQSGNSTIYSYSMPASIVKVESGYEEDDDDVVEITRNPTEHDDLSSNSLKQLDESSATLMTSTLISLPKESTYTEQGDDGNSSETMSNIDPEYTSPPPPQPPTHQQTATQLKLDIRSALINHVDGRQAIEFYEINGKLDYANRKKIVSVIINSAIDKNVWMCSSEFKRMADEIIQIFPNESYLTYYIPREGTQNPRGALYNKFLNLSRKLRQEGLMQYRRISTQISPNCTLRSTRNFKQYQIID